MAPEVAGLSTPYSSASNALSTDSRADEVFHAHQQALFTRTDRMFAYLMGGQWLAAILFALVVAPLLPAYAGLALFLYPAADLLHPHGFTAALAPSLPVGLHGLLKVCQPYAQLCLV